MSSIINSGLREGGKRKHLHVDKVMKSTKIVVLQIMEGDGGEFLSKRIMMLSAEPGPKKFFK